MRIAQTRQVLASRRFAGPRDRLLKLIIVAAALVGAWWLGPRASPQMVAAVVAVVCVVVVIHRPVLGPIGLVLAGALVPMELSTGTSTTVNIVVIGLCGMAALWCIRMLLDRRLVLAPSSANGPWMAICALAGMSIVAGAATWNPWVMIKSNFVIVQIAQWAVFILAAIAYWLPGNYAPDRRMLQWIVAIVLALAVVMVVGLALPFGFRLFDRVLMNGPILRIWAAALSLAFALQLRELAPRIRTALVGLSLAVVLVPFIWRRDWASGWMPGAAAVGAVVLIWLWTHRRQVALAVVSLSSVVLALVGILALSRLDRWSLDTRLIAWGGLAELLQGHWLFGLGLASYWHYWRGVIGSFSYLDPSTGYLHLSTAPAVNMHSSFVDVLGQMGIVGVVALIWLLVALYHQAARTYSAERDPFGRAFATASFGALTGMCFAGMLGDWFFPFVYNIGLKGFRDAFIGWLLLGGLVLLDVTRERDAGQTGAPASADLT